MSEEAPPLKSTPAIFAADDPIDIASEVIPIQDFLKTHTASDLVPESGKVVVLEIQLTIWDAFQGLQENGITSAPLWDNRRLEYAGILTVSDYVDIVLHLSELKDESTFLEQMQNMTLFEWRQLKQKQRKEYKQSCETQPLESGQTPPSVPTEIQLSRPAFIVGHVDASLFDTSRLLLLYQIHRCPIYSPEYNTVLHIATQARILRYFVTHWKFPYLPKLLARTIADLNIGTSRANLQFLRQSSLILDGLRTLSLKHVSALPILDDDDNVVGVFSMSDVKYLDLENLRAELSMTCAEFLQVKKTRVQIGSGIEPSASSSSKPEIITCTKHDTLVSVIGRLARYNIHRIIVLNEQNHIEGLISVNDILRLFVMG
ncbi:putative 5'-AMP-activated protein kinase subunit gamma [Blattamonas nauphoetae]|uniref:5'-AMP-activated protein kinase subunit gamma n=1 Tax=Blattamonas nauphoetae TaxID=2049346 RepID=A0ABQ9YFV8_9EUKA|nr:putative 5'-AMP-activated protein kinase subunit gamma [Blattamonas nauphoetae]